MKLTELLTEGSPLARKPQYDASAKKVLGAADAWFEKIGVTPDDVKAALVKVKQTPEFKAITAVAPYITKNEKMGTLVFGLGGRGGREMATVTALGQIRFQDGPSESLTRYRVNSPKPALVHGKPVESLLKTYKAALIELAKKPRIKALMT